MNAVTLDQARIALRKLRALLEGVEGVEAGLDFRAGGYGVKVVVTQTPPAGVVPDVVEGVEVRVEKA